MVLLPILAAAAISAAAGAIGSRISSGHAKARAAEEASYRNKETKRDTLQGLKEEKAHRKADKESHRIAEKKKLNKKKAQSMQETSELVREAFKI